MKNIATAIPLPRRRSARVKSAILHTISLAHLAIVQARGWAANGVNPRVREAEDIERITAEVAMLREELAIKDARFRRIMPQHRPHYTPHERMRILELKAARGWSAAQMSVGAVASQTMSLWRGDLTLLVVPFSAFVPAASGTQPNFERFAVTDYGHTLRFGNYEAAADAVLYENDAEFRRRLNRRRVAEEQTLGASIRRLRMQRQMTQHDFPGLEPKTLARIERGEVKKPQQGTLKLIADRLGVDLDELRDY